MIYRRFPNPYPDAVTFEQPVTLGKSGGTSGSLNFIASDGDSGNLSINTSDELLVSGFQSFRINSNAGNILPFTVFNSLGNLILSLEQTGANGGRFDVYNSLGIPKFYYQAGSDLFYVVLNTYPDNASAILGGLVANQIYKTATGELRIVV